MHTLFISMIALHTEQINALSLNCVYSKAKVSKMPLINARAWEGNVLRRYKPSSMAATWTEVDIVPRI